MTPPNDPPSSEPNDLPTEGASPQGSREQFSSAAITAAAVHPERIGHYRVRELLGQGGMGFVYLAQREDDRFKQRVALKVMKDRGVDTAEVIRRFEVERRVLSALNHPNIARLLDGGTTSEGLPYFAMEYIEGLPIDVYCDRNSLTTKQRIALFQMVCNAVQYAHQNLIVHRDIKPGNILVTNEGEPKLLDFGIAKLLNAPLMGGDAMTGPLSRLMTYEYASPEQVRGEPVSTASDVYALGVLLYELLTGRRPYDFPKRLEHEIVRVICDEEPKRPSTAISEVFQVHEPGGTTRTVDPATTAKTREGDITRLRKRLRGELDDIVMKALEKIPQRRYPSAEQLADDLTRHLEGMPVRARPQSVAYRASKFLRRNRALVASLLIVFLSLAVGGIAATWGYFEAESQRKTAVEQRNRAEKATEQLLEATEFFLVDITAWLAQAPRALEPREQVALFTQSFLEVLQANGTDSPEVQRGVSNAYERLGQAAADIRGGSSLNFDEALNYQERARDIRIALLSENPSDASLRVLVATSHIRIADLRRELGDKDEASDSYQRAIDTLSQLNRTNTEEPLFLQASVRYIGAIANLGELFQARGDFEAARRQFTDSLRIREERFRSVDTRNARRNITVGQGDLALFLLKMNEPENALPLHERAVEVRDELLGQVPDSARYARDLALMLAYLSETNMRLDRLDEALANIDRAYNLMQDLVAQEQQAEQPDQRQFLTQGFVAAQRARVMLAAGDAPAAEASAQVAVELLEPLATAIDTSDSNREYYVEALVALSRAIAAQDPRDAEEHASDAITIARELHSASQAKAASGVRLAIALTALAEAQTGAGQSERKLLQGQRAYEEAIEIYQSLESEGLLSPYAATLKDACIAALAAQRDG